MWRKNNLGMYCCHTPALRSIKKGGKLVTHRSDKFLSSYVFYSVSFLYCLHAHENNSGLIQSPLNVHACTSALVIDAIQLCDGGRCNLFSFVSIKHLYCLNTTVEKIYLINVIKS